MTNDARRLSHATTYPLHVRFQAGPSAAARFFGRFGLGSSFAAVGIAVLMVASGLTGARLSAALAARSDVPLGAQSSVDGGHYRLLGSVIANQPLTNDLASEIDAEPDEDEQPPLQSAMAFNAGAFEPDARSLLDKVALVTPERFTPGAPDFARVSRFEIGRYEQDLALADVTPLPRRRPKLAALTPFDGLGVTPEENFNKTAIYDITSRVVYMPNGDRLEAHSGLGPKMDDPRHVHIRMHGATPPNTYRLTMREKLFHGVEAIRLTPVGEGNMYGRAGILAHPYMLGPNGQSNGCVSFKDYPKFLAAFKRGEVERIVVVSKLERAPAFAKAEEPKGKFASLLKLFGVE